MISAFAVPQFGQVIADSRITEATHANMKPSTTRTAPRERTHVTRAVTTGLPHAILVVGRNHKIPLRWRLCDDARCAMGSASR